MACKNLLNLYHENFRPTIRANKEGTTNCQRDDKALLPPSPQKRCGQMRLPGSGAICPCQAQTLPSRTQKTIVPPMPHTLLQSPDEGADAGSDALERTTDAVASSADGTAPSLGRASQMTYISVSYFYNRHGVGIVHPTEQKKVTHTAYGQCVTCKLGMEVNRYVVALVPTHADGLRQTVIRLPDAFRRTP